MCPLDPFCGVTCYLFTGPNFAGAMTAALIKNKQKTTTELLNKCHKSFSYRLQKNRLSRSSGSSFACFKCQVWPALSIRSMCLGYHGLVHPPCCSFSFCSLCFSCSAAIALCRGALTQSSELALYCSFVKQQFLCPKFCCISGCDLVCHYLCKAKWDESPYLGVLPRTGNVGMLWEVGGGQQFRGLGLEIQHGLGDGSQQGQKTSPRLGEALEMEEREKLSLMLFSLACITNAKVPNR